MKVPQISLKDFEFNHFAFSEYLVVEDIRRKQAIDVSNIWTEIPGNQGQLFLYNHLKGKRIEVTCRLLWEKWLDLDMAVSFLASKLYTNEPKELFLRDSVLSEFAIVDGSVEAERHGNTLLLTITFINPTGLRYGQLLEQEFDKDTTLEIFNNGTTNADFIVKATIDGSTASIARADSTHRLKWQKLTKGELLEINTKYRTCKGKSARKGLTLDSRFFTLQSGVNNLEFKGLTGVVSWRNTWI